MGFGVWSLDFGDWGLDFGFGVCGLWFGVWVLEFEVRGLGLRVWGGGCALVVEEVGGDTPHRRGVHLHKEKYETSGQLGQDEPASG